MPVTLAKNGQLELYLCNCLPPPPIQLFNEHGEIIVNTTESTTTDKKQKFTYPQARRDYTNNIQLHGLTIVDPYRWLQESIDVENFIIAQNQFTQQLLSACTYKSDITETICQLSKFERCNNFYRYDSRYFYRKCSQLTDECKFYVKSSWQDLPKLFFDPTNLVHYLAAYKFSPNGIYFAYMLHKQNIYSRSIHFLDTVSGVHNSDTLVNIRSETMEWNSDSNGLFYICYPDRGNYHMQNIYYHQIGDNQRNDLHIYSLNDPSIVLDIQVSDYGSYLICLPSKLSMGNLIYFVHLKEHNVTANITWIPIITHFYATFKYITTRNSLNYFLTNWNALHYRIIAIDFNCLQPNRYSWKPIICEDVTRVIDWAAPASQQFLLVCFIKFSVHVLNLYNLDGEIIHEFRLESGTITDHFSSVSCTEIIIVFESFLIPEQIFRCDLQTLEQYKMEQMYQIDLKHFKPSLITIEQVIYKKVDNLLMTMFLLYGNNIEKNGKNACLLYGNSTHKCTLTPVFNVLHIVFVQCLHGVVAIVNTRGGGEYGDRSHLAGRQHNKQNSFDDFQSAVQYLIDNKYTSAKLLTISGDGTTVAVCINQRPELYACAICERPITDLLTMDNNDDWISEYGNPKLLADFKCLLQYSPYHDTHIPNVLPQYPAVFVLASEDDAQLYDALKYTAQLQYIATQSSIQTNPFLLRVFSNEEIIKCDVGETILSQIDIICFITHIFKLSFHCII